MSRTASPDRPALDRFVLCFDAQEKVCAHFGSPLYAGLCAAVRDAFPTSDGLRALAAGFEGDPLEKVFAIRLLAGVHAQVLAGAGGELARFYPSLGGRATLPEAGPAFVRFVEANAGALAPWLAAVPQTNEVGRSAALLGGFLEIARATRRPLALREIGSSAGLNLFFDRFQYRLGPHRWGDPAAPVRLAAEWRSKAAPAFDTPLQVLSRAGCDLSPVDLEQADARRRLEAYVWPDQLERFETLRAAIALARAEGVHVEAASASSWLARLLASDRDCDRQGAATVVFHSIMWMYLPAAERLAIQRTIEAAGARATPEAPLAWLQLEDGLPRTALKLRLWPHATGERVLAEAHPHAAWIQWHPSP